MQKIIKIYLSRSASGLFSKSSSSFLTQFGVSGGPVSDRLSRLPDIRDDSDSRGPRVKPRVELGRGLTLLFSLCQKTNLCLTNAMLQSFLKKNC